MNLERNVGRTDKNLRITAGIGLILIGIFFAHSFLLTLVGAIVLATGIFSFCGAYKLLGINTATADEQRSAKADLSDRATDNLEDYKEEVIETAHEVRQKAGELAEDAKEEIAELKEDAEEMVQTAKKKIDEKIDEVKKKNT